MAYSRAYYLRNKAKMNADATARRKANPKAAADATKRWRQKTGYTTQPSRLKTLERLAGRPRPDKCECCGAGGRICWDHDHTTGLFRGWLCESCNKTLGMAQDDIARLRALVTYLGASRE